MSALADNFAAVRAQIAAACQRVGRAPDDVELLAVSKRHPASAVTEAMAAGQRRYGENRVQELSAKAAELGAIEGLGWHLIGSLQTNKVRELLRVPGLELVHSCDRAKLADALHRELAASGRTLDVLEFGDGTVATPAWSSPDPTATLRDDMLEVGWTLRRVRLVGDLLTIIPNPARVIVLDQAFGFHGPVDRAVIDRATQEVPAP